MAQWVEVFGEEPPPPPKFAIFASARTSAKIKKLLIDCTAFEPTHLKYPLFPTFDPPVTIVYSQKPAFTCSKFVSFRTVP